MTVLQDPPANTSVAKLSQAGRISRQLFSALDGAGFTDLSELSGYGLRRLRMVRGFGKATVEELRLLLDELGIAL